MVVYLGDIWHACSRPRDSHPERAVVLLTPARRSSVERDTPGRQAWNDGAFDKTRKAGDARSLSDWGSKVSAKKVMYELLSFAEK